MGTLRGHSATGKGGDTEKVGGEGGTVTWGHCQRLGGRDVVPWGHRRDTEFGMRGTHGDTASDWGRWEHSARGKGGDTERVWGEGDTEGTLPDTAVGTLCHTMGRWGHGDVGTPPEFGVTVLWGH